MKVQRMIYVDAAMEVKPRTLSMHDESGRRCGIQEFVGPTFVEASSACPLCGVDTPHAHTDYDLRWLRAMDDYLSSKLGVPLRIDRKSSEDS